MESGGGDLQAMAENWQTPGTDSFRSRGGERVNEEGIDQQARNWQSPQARDHRSGEIDPAIAAKHLGSRPLNEEVLNWPSPRSEDAEFCGNHPGSTDSLTGAVRNWSTPKADEKEGGRTANGNPKKDGIPLNMQARNWSTPYGAMGQEADGTYGCGGEHAKEALLWPDPSRSLPTAPETSPDGRPCWCGTPGCVLRSHKRRLNVWFDENLMGWPMNWSSAQNAPTGFAQWEMEFAALLSAWLFEYSRSGPAFAGDGCLKTERDNMIPMQDICPDGYVPADARATKFAKHHPDYTNHIPQYRELHALKFAARSPTTTKRCKPCCSM